MIPARNTLKILRWPPLVVDPPKMAHDQSALTDLLDALRSGGDLYFMCEAMQLVLQALIDLDTATDKIW